MNKLDKWTNTRKATQKNTTFKIQETKDKKKNLREKVGEELNTFHLENQG
jgi:hypothetical protein